MAKRLNLKAGDVFNRLTVIGETSWVVKESGKRERTQKCICSCGNIHYATSSNLTSGAVKSCGCLKKEVERTIRITHGMTNTKIYETWGNIKQRCLNPSNPHYHNYGGRGITINKDWLDFKVFHRDVGDRPEGMELERKDNNKGYNKENCIWTTRSEQNRNKRKVKGLTSKYMGVHQPKGSCKWVATVNAIGKNEHLGTFALEEQAAQAYNDAIDKYNLNPNCKNIIENIE